MLKALLRRELITPLRRRRMIVFQIGLAFLFGLLIAIRWPTEGHVAMTGSRSQQIFHLFSYGLIATLLLLLPVFPATSIVSEKRRGTLALLLNTPLGPLRIFFGKFLATLSLAGMILAMSLPAAGACYSMGGLSLYEDIFKVYLLLLLVALQYTAIGLLVSSYVHSIDSGVRVTYGIVLATTVMTLGPHYFFQGTEGPLADLGETLRSLSPLSSLAGAEAMGGQGLMTKSDVLGKYIVWSVAVHCCRFDLDDQPPESQDLRRIPRCGNDERRLVMVEAVDSTTVLPRRSQEAIQADSESFQSGHGQGVSIAPFWTTSLAASTDRGLRNFVIGSDVCIHRGHVRLGRGNHRSHHGGDAGGVDHSDCSKSFRRTCQHRTRTRRLGASPDDAHVSGTHRRRQVAQRGVAADADSVRDDAGLPGDGLHCSRYAVAGSASPRLPRIDRGVFDADKCCHRMHVHSNGRSHCVCVWRFARDLCLADAGLDGTRCPVRP
jgi:hypothetical protein